MSTPAPHDRSGRQAKINAATPKESKVKPILGIIIALVAVVGIGAAIWFGMQQTGTDTENVAAPARAQGAGQGILLNPTDPPEGVPTLDIYEDYQCPACGIWHGHLAETIDQMARDNTARVVIHSKNFLDANLNNDQSTRAANAAACAADVSPEAYMSMHDGIYDTQPQSEGEGWSDETLSTLADDAGITGEARTTYDQCVAGGTYNDYVNAVEEESSRNGVTATPTYRLDGEDFDLGQLVDQQNQTVDPAALVQAVEAAGQG